MARPAPSTPDAIVRTEPPQLEQIVASTSATIFVKDLDGRYVYVNREFERLKGLPVDAIVGRRDVELFPAAAPAFCRNDRRVVDERRAIEFEETVDTAQGQRVYLSHKFPLLDAAGRAYAVCGVATDITDRKRSEDALRAAALAVSGAEGDAAYAELVRSLAGILGADVAMIAVYVDEARTRMRTLAAILDGKPRASFEYALAGSPCRHVVGRAFRFVPSGVNAEFPPGTLFRAKGMDSYAAWPVNDAAGRPLGLIAAMSRRPMDDPALAEAMLKIFAVRVAAQIEREQAEATLRASEASYRAIFEASEDAIFVHDWDSGAILDANPKACRTYGYSVDEFRRHGVEAVSAGFAPYTAADAERWIERAKAGERLSFEWRRRNRDGTLHWDEVYLKAVEIAGARRILATTRDITARKAAEEALRASGEQYRAIFDASVDGLVLWDREGRIVDVNAAVSRTLGYSRSELVGSDGDAIMPPALRERCERLRAALLAGGRCREELWALRKDGTRIDVEIRGATMHYRDAPHALLILRDLTERRAAECERAKLEARLRQSQKMEALGHLAGGIAHDFNNLLTAIMGYVTLAAERAGGGDAKVATYLEQAGLACGRARDLIQQMLTFSRGRRGERRALALAPLVRESVKLLRASLPATIALAADLDDDAAPVLADPVQLEQVLMNLAINARDAMDGSGELRIAVRRARIGGAVCASCRGGVDAECVELAVADSGPGIAPGVQERMFEPFFTTKEVGHGTGMGLATVHGIVHEHGGHVVVESQPGRGATFRVLLPAMDVSARVDAAGERDRPERALPRVALSGSVAVVDDEASVAQFMHELLANWGLGVTTFTDAVGALTALSRGDAFDLLITDQTMPAVTGLDLARVCRRLRPQMPVVLYTGYGEQIAAADLDGAGVVAMLAKPLAPAALLDVLRAHLPAAARG